MSDVIAVGGFAIVGALGGLSRALVLKVSLADGLTSVVVGGLLAAFVSPTFEPELQSLITNWGWMVDPDRLPWFSSYATGTLGVAVLGLFIDVGARILKRWADKQEQSNGGGKP